MLRAGIAEPRPMKCAIATLNNIVKMFKMLDKCR